MGPVTTRRTTNAKVTNLSPTSKPTVRICCNWHECAYCAQLNITKIFAKIIAE